MNKVKQISLDIVVDESTDGYELNEEVADVLENCGYIVLGSSFQDDMTDSYKNTEYDYNLV